MVKKRSGLSQQLNQYPDVMAILAALSAAMTFDYHRHRPSTLVVVAALEASHSSS
jgi:hypothetical protein